MSRHLFHHLAKGVFGVCRLLVAAELCHISTFVLVFLYFFSRHHTLKTLFNAPWTRSFLMCYNNFKDLPQIVSKSEGTLVAFSNRFSFHFVRIWFIMIRFIWFGNVSVWTESFYKTTGSMCIRYTFVLVWTGTLVDFSICFSKTVDARRTPLGHSCKIACD